MDSSKTAEYNNNDMDVTNNEVAASTATAVSVGVKSTCRTDKRRFQLAAASTVDDLRRIVCAVHGIELATPVHITWTDEDGDEITIGSTPDLVEAVNAASALLRVTVMPLTVVPGDVDGKALSPVAAPAPAAAVASAANAVAAGDVDVAMVAAHSTEEPPRSVNAAPPVVIGAGAGFGAAAAAAGDDSGKVADADAVVIADDAPAMLAFAALLSPEGLAGAGLGDMDPLRVVNLARRMGVFPRRFVKAGIVTRDNLRAYKRTFPPKQHWVGSARVHANRAKVAAAARFGADLADDDIADAALVQDAFGGPPCAGFWRGRGRGRGRGRAGRGGCGRGGRGRGGRGRGGQFANWFGFGGRHHGHHGPHHGPHHGARDHGSRSRSPVRRHGKHGHRHGHGHCHGHGHQGKHGHHGQHAHRGRRAHGGHKNAVARFVKHVTYDCGTPVEPGLFEKVWRVRNDSDAPWPAVVHLIHVGGDVFGTADMVTPVRGGVVPGEEVDLCLNLTAPCAAGHYHGHWRLADETGHRFGPRLGVNVIVPADGGTAGVVVGHGAGAGFGFGSGGHHNAEMNTATVNALLAGASAAHRAAVEAMVEAGAVPHGNPVIVKAVLKRLNKVKGDITDTKLSKIQTWAIQRTETWTRKAAKHAEKAARKQAKLEAKRARKAACAARKAAAAEARRVRREAQRAARASLDDGKSVSTSSSDSSDTSSSDSDAE